MSFDKLEQEPKIPQYDCLDTLNKGNTFNTSSRRITCEMDLNVVISKDKWEEILYRIHFSLSSNQFIERQFKMVHRLFITLEKLKKVNPTRSDFCIKF